MILSFPSWGEMKWSVTIIWEEVQGSLSSTVSLLFPGSLLYTKRSFRKIHYSVSISDSELLESIIHAFKIIQVGKVAIYIYIYIYIYIDRVRNIFICWDYYLDVRRAKINRNTILGRLKCHCKRTCNKSLVNSVLFTGAGFTFPCANKYQEYALFSLNLFQ
jgi:hypothetical protein